MRLIKLLKRSIKLWLTHCQAWMNGKDFQKKKHLLGFLCRHISDRRITASIGIATTGPLSIAEDKKQAAQELLNKADIALYRAKSGGRNTIRNFSEILAKYGRVLAHHPDTNIVTIDIGRQVNVNLGQEFLVYHPDFAGETPYIYQDGRTKKRLGIYPKYSYGHIVAFDVQQEISFCTIVNQNNTNPFPTGAIIEAIPLGSISHLLTAQMQAAGAGINIADLTQTKNLPKLIQDLLSKKKKYAVAVFRVPESFTVD